MKKKFQQKKKFNEEKVSTKLKKKIIKNKTILKQNQYTINMYSTDDGFGKSETTLVVSRFYESINITILYITSLNNNYECGKPAYNITCSFKYDNMQCCFSNAGGKLHPSSNQPTRKYGSFEEQVNSLSSNNSRSVAYQPFLLAKTVASRKLEASSTILEPTAGYKSRQTDGSKNWLKLQLQTIREVSTKFHLKGIKTFI